MDSAKIIVLIVLSLFTPTNFYAKNKAIVVGASSGIGRAIAKKLSEKYDVGIVARRTELLNTLKQEILHDNATQDSGPQVFIKTIDVTQVDTMQQRMIKLVEEMGGKVDLVVISIRASIDAQVPERDSLNVDLIGFYNVASFVLEIFMRQKNGHLVGISSMDGLKGSAGNPVYCASKAFISRYLEGERNFMSQKGFHDIFITDILPGWVDTEKLKFSNMLGTYLVIDAKAAADLICQAIVEKRPRAIIPKEWEVVAQLWNDVPDSVYNSWLPWR